MAKYKDYKQGSQESLFPLDISSLIPTNHLVRHISSVIDRLDSRFYEQIFSNKGASSYHPQMMLKVIIYAYCTKNYSCRKIAAMLRQDITYMWLSGTQTPDFNTINRFRTHYLKDVPESAFSEVLLFLHEHDFIRFENYFIDGTKLEADAGKYTHVWKKNTERYKDGVKKRISNLFEEIEELNKEEDSVFENGDLPEMGDIKTIKSDDIDKVVDTIHEKVEKKKINYPGSRDENTKARPIN